MNIPNDLPRLPPRKADGHKGIYGRVLVVGGSLGMAGAPALAAMAALRSGAGLVQVACPRLIVPTVSGFDPCYTVLPLAYDGDGRWSGADIETVRLAKKDVLAIGPGLGQSDQLRIALADLLAAETSPVVIDADALNLLAGQVDAVLSGRPGDTILTPHPGEFARLVPGSDLSTPQKRLHAAKRLAASLRVTVILKGNGSVVTDGVRTAVNETGNPGMATGGAGDVLTGIIAALVGQGLSAFDAARLGAFVHGLAGDLAADHFGQVSLTARDLIAWLPKAFNHIAAEPAPKA